MIVDPKKYSYATKALKFSTKMFQLKYFVLFVLLKIIKVDYLFLTQNYSFVKKSKILTKALQK